MSRKLLTDFRSSVNEALRLLATDQKLFHNELHFQVLLAIELQKRLPNATVHPEYRFRGDTTGRMDLLIREGKYLHGIELKYATRELRIEIDDQPFDLKHHGARDHRSYDILLDIARVEEFVSCNHNATGSVIAVTNDASLALERTQRHIDYEFGLVNGRMLNGTMNWAPHAGVGSTKGRERGITLDGKYIVDWQPFSDLNVKNGQFQILQIHIGF